MNKILQYQSILQNPQSNTYKQWNYFQRWCMDKWQSGDFSNYKRGTYLQKLSLLKIGIQQSACIYSPLQIKGYEIIKDAFLKTDKIKEGNNPRRNVTNWHSFCKQPNKISCYDYHNGLQFYIEIWKINSPSFAEITIIWIPCLYYCKSLYFAFNRWNKFANKKKSVWIVCLD